MDAALLPLAARARGKAFLEALLLRHGPHQVHYVEHEVLERLGNEAIRLALSLRISRVRCCGVTARPTLAVRHRAPPLGCGAPPSRDRCAGRILARGCGGELAGTVRGRPSGAPHRGRERRHRRPHRRLPRARERVQTGRRHPVAEPRGPPSERALRRSVPPPLRHKRWNVWRPSRTSRPWTARARRRPMRRPRPVHPCVHPSMNSRRKVRFSARFKSLHRHQISR